MITESQSILLAARVSREKQQPIVVRQWRLHIADERITVQIGDDRRVQSVGTHELTERRALHGQRIEQLPKSRSLYFKLGEACTLARNAEEFDVHDFALSARNRT